MKSDGSFNVTHPSQIMLSVTAGTIGSIGLPGNFFLMLLIASEYKKRKPHEWLLFNLAMGDFLLCLNNAALEAPFILDFTRNACKAAGAFDYIFGTVSFFTPPLVAYNRYLSLYDNQMYTKVFTNRNVIVAWGSILLFSLAWTIPFAATGNLGRDDLGVCGTQIRNNFLAAIMCGVLVAIFTSYGLLVYFSYKIIIKIRNHRKRPAAERRFQSRLINESQEIITAMLIISAVPLFAQVPAATMKMLNIFLPPFDPWVPAAAVAPFSLTSAVNAYVTIYVIKDYRKKVLQFFKKTPPVTTNTEPAAVQGMGAWMINVGLEFHNSHGATRPASSLRADKQVENASSSSRALVGERSQNNPAGFA